MFKYNLESVLNLRENIEDVKKKELGIANQKYEQEVIVKKNLLTLESNLNAEMRDTKLDKQCIDINYMCSAHSYVSLIRSKIKDQEQQVVNAANEVDKKRDELIVSVKQRKILENLKAIKYDEYLIDESRAERSIMDEIITYKYRSNHKEDV